jgi:hypothetical protein
MLPQDPFILYSYLNTQLRDFYPNLDALCDDLDEDKDAIIEKLSAVGFEYNEARNQFV